MKDIYKFIKVICNDLKIKKPKVQVTKSFISNTQLASYDPSREIITIKKEYENMYDVCFAISHELRHKYQIDYKLFDFKNYKSNSQTTSIEYNLQPEELDANAYAYLIMMSAFGVEAKFNGVDQTVISAIKKRAIEIMNQKKAQ